MNPILIVTRPAPQGEVFADAVLSQWSGSLRVIQSPLIAIKPVSVVTELSEVRHVIFTSVNGVVAAGNLSIPAGVTAWCVGKKTALHAEQAGFLPVIGPGDADGLAKLIISRAPAGAFVHIRGRHSRGAISQRLNDAGINCNDVVAYDQTACMLNADAKLAVKGKDLVLFPLFSPRTATILSQQGPFDVDTHLVMMSNAVREAATLAAATVTMALHPTEDAMVAATRQALRGLTQRRG